MKTWTDALTSGDQQIAGWLLEHGCEFIWRDGPRGDPGPEPIESEGCWFEVWCGPELLSFVGPFVWPMPEEGIRASGRFMFRQGLMLVKPRHRR